MEQSNFDVDNGYFSTLKNYLNNVQEVYGEGRKSEDFLKGQAEAEAFLQTKPSLTDLYNELFRKTLHWEHEDALESPENDPHERQVEQLEHYRSAFEDNPYMLEFADTLKAAIQKDIERDRLRQPTPDGEIKETKEKIINREGRDDVRVRRSTVEKGIGYEVAWNERSPGRIQVRQTAPEPAPKQLKFMTFVVPSGSFSAIRARLLDPKSFVEDAFRTIELKDIESIGFSGGNLAKNNPDVYVRLHVRPTVEVISLQKDGKMKKYKSGKKMVGFVKSACKEGNTGMAVALIRKHDGDLDFLRDDDPAGGNTGMRKGISLGGQDVPRPNRREAKISPHRYNSVSRDKGERGL